jgi:hypothetical protein
VRLPCTSTIRCGVSRKPPSCLESCSNLSVQPLVHSGKKIMLLCHFTRCLKGRSKFFLHDPASSSLLTGIFHPAEPWTACLLLQLSLMFLQSGLAAPWWHPWASQQLLCTATKEQLADRTHCEDLLCSPSVFSCVLFAIRSALTSGIYTLSTPGGCPIQSGSPSVFLPNLELMSFMVSFEHC